MRELLKRKKSSMPWSTLAGKAIKNVWGQGLCRISQIALMGSIHITGVVGRYRIKGGQKKISSPIQRIGAPMSIGAMETSMQPINLWEAGFSRAHRLTILENCPNHGEAFLVSALLEPKYAYFQYSYTFNEKGEITGHTARHYTGRNQNEIDRYRRVAIEAVYDYSEKENRNNKHNLVPWELATLKDICSSIESGSSVLDNKQRVIALVETIENRIIRSL